MGQLAKVAILTEQQYAAFNDSIQRGHVIVCGSPFRVNWFPHTAHAQLAMGWPTDKFHCQLTLILPGQKKAVAAVVWAKRTAGANRRCENPAAASRGQENSGPSDREPVSPSLSTVLIIAIPALPAAHSALDGLQFHVAPVSVSHIPYCSSVCLCAAAWGSLAGWMAHEASPQSSGSVARRTAAEESKRSTTAHDFSVFYLWMGGGAASVWTEFSRRLRSAFSPGPGHAGDPGPR